MTNFVGQRFRAIRAICNRLKGWGWGRLQRHSTHRLLALLAVPIVLAAPTKAAVGAEFQVAPFTVDVTPPVDDWPCIGIMPQADSIEHPLLLKGIVAECEQGRFVIAAVDFCGICNSSDVFLHGALASAAGTTLERVALQSLHQHSAPTLDADTARLLFGETGPRFLAHQRFSETVARRSTESIHKALKKMQPVTRIVATKAMVDRVASNRRVRQSDGTIGVRYSLTRDATIREADLGLIDPWLRTLTFFNGAQAVVHLHYYATHPQTSVDGHQVSWDTVGIARERAQQQSGVPTIYFTGCGGNVTVGKFNDGTRDSRETLASRLLDAMQQSQAAVGKKPDLDIDLTKLSDDDVRWQTAEVEFQIREDAPYHLAALRQQLHPDQRMSDRLKAACFLAFRERLAAGHHGVISRLRIGPLDMLQLPGEPFVEYQLYAQQVARTGSFVCAAGYGDCGVWYYGPDTIYQDRGGFEQTWSVTGPCQEQVEAALLKLLR